MLPCLLDALHRFACVDAQCLVFGVVPLSPMCHVCSRMFSQLYLCVHRTHPSFCSKPSGTCLKNQIGHYLSEDNERLAIGLPPLHMAHRFAQVGMVSYLVNMSEPANGDRLKMKFSVPSITDTKLHLEFAADDLSFMPKDPPGKVCHFMPQLYHLAIASNCGCLHESLTASASPI
jgi:hypothetical protein